ncbi:MAG: MASE1 domain-containing protein [Gemmatimonadaceae bacterium]|nr:MASE1 domain-containing protein [Gemmatimonadaceae bacterium]
MPPFLRRPLAANIALALVYALLGVATLALGQTAGVELRRVIWVSSGVAVAAGLLAPFPMWLGAGIGGALATALSGSGPIMIVGTGVANGLEVLLTVSLLRRQRFSPALERISDILALILMGSGVAALIAAVLSVSALALSGLIGSSTFLRVLLLWWLTHAMGILVITPVALTLVRTRAAFARRHPAEVVGVLSAVAMTTWLPFFAEGNGVLSRLFLLPFPPLLWAAVRLGMGGASLGGLIATSIAMVAAVRHTGPLAVGTPNETLFLTWLSSNVVMLATLLSTALVAGIEKERAALQSGEARLRAVLDSASEGIVVTDATGLVTHVNRSIADMWPAPIPQPRLDAHIAESLGALADAIGNADERALLVAAPEPAGRRGTLSLPDGRVWEVLVDPLRGSDVRRGSVWSFLDITTRIRADEERQHLQAQLLHGQKLESLGVMAGGIAHDFNNLLMAIRARAELIGDTDALPDDARVDVEGILRTSDQAAALCRQMLTYAGRGAIEIRTVDLSACAREIQDLLRVSVSRQVALQLELSAEALWVAADVTQVRQIVLNLVTNASDAVEATGRGGTVRVRTYPSFLGRDWLARAVIGLDVAEGEFCVLEVRDDGVGMTEATINQIFDPFFSSKGTGRGLGLASALGVIRGHKGALAVESRPGGGSRFVVAFPRADATRGAAPRTEAAPLSGAFEGRTILLVDDDEAVRGVVSRLLELMGMRVSQAVDGDDALQQLSTEAGRRVDVVLLDLTMPRRSGPATLAAMRAMGLDTPVIIASGYSAEAVNEATIAGFVQKPFDSDDLRRAIERALANGPVRG